MPNTSGSAYGLTVLSPIADDRGKVPSTTAQLRAFLGTLGRGVDSPFARMLEHHFIRFVVIDDVFFEGYPAKVDHLRSPYLLFTSDFNGDLHAYLRKLVATAPREIEGIWGHCHGFPGTSDPSRFIDYIERCQITTNLYFADNPDTTVEQVLRALQVQRRMIGFIERTQGSSAEPLQEAFRRFITEIRGLPTPPAGSV